MIIIMMTSESYSQKISIIYKVENIPITNIEIENEINYLLLINDSLRQIDKNSIVKYATKSIIKEKVKEIEIKKNYLFGKNQKIVDENLKKLMLSLNIENQDEFRNLLANLQLSKDYLEKKIELEIMWNRLIYEIYKDKIFIDESKLKQELEKKLQDSSHEINEFLLFEILFNPSTTDQVDEEFNKIKKSIDEIGFENTANVLSNSNTSTRGGKIGWVNENQLSKPILEKIKILNLEGYTDPINAPGGKIILMVKEKRKIESNLSFDEELSKIINIERNKQLNQYSSIYYKKIELNTRINEN